MQKAEPSLYMAELLQTLRRGVTNELNQTGDSEIFIHKLFFKQSLLKNMIDGFWDRI